MRYYVSSNEGLRRSGELGGAGINRRRFLADVPTYRRVAYVRRVEQTLSVSDSVWELIEIEIEIR